MLQNIRDNIQGTLAKVIIAIICIPFVLFGVESLVGVGGSGDVAEVNGVEITEQQLIEATELRKRQLIAQMGDNLDPSMLEDSRLRSEALQSLIDKELLLQQARNMELIVSKDQLDRAIVNNPDFQQDGEFSNELFHQRLLAAGFNAEIFTRLYRHDLLVNQLASGIVSTGFMTEQEMAINARFTYEKRDIRYITLDIAKMKNSLKPSADELKAYYDAHQSEYKTDEYVDVEYIELNLQDFIKPVDESVLKQAYSDELASRNSSDQREISHLLLDVNGDRSKKDAIALLNQIKGKLAGGAKFADLVAEYSEDLGSKGSDGYLGVFDEQVFPPEFAPAVTSLEEGGVSDVVSTDAGVHLIRLNRLVKDNPPTFAERKADLEQHLALEQAQPAFYEAVEILKNESFNAADLAGPSEMVDSPIKFAGKVKRTGTDGIFANPQIVSALYSEEVLTDGQNSEAVEIDPEHVVVVRVKEHKLPEVMPYEQVEGRVVDSVKTDQAKELLQNNAAVIEAELVAGGDVEKVAQKSGDAWQLLLAATRNQPQDREIIDAAFKLPTAPAGQRAIDTVDLASGNVAIITVDNVKQGELADIPEQERQLIRAYLGRAMAAEIFSEFEQSIENNADIEVL
ncbi:Peptidyl-prolyl cis-trans isomerase D [BD1-7 clade bacterium]|uniref:Periplasmic chaperone PpiD n=1 Tax=BD1-7 clade bacterium TaxID=2029982 RepID=A0A5S9QLL3_9GAMM|nr:Peptidyl-prolyl cis-trans isomerase D [BD1-7 clade bacterium]